MHSLLINTYDRGGAAKACLRLHQGLLSQNINSKVLLKSRLNDNIPETYLFHGPDAKTSLQSKIYRKGAHLLEELLGFDKVQKELISYQNSRKSGFEAFTLPFSNLDITKNEFYKKADVVNLHWVADFIDYKSFFKKNTKPVVWTLHDMNPFSGGEHFEEIYYGMDINGNPIKRILSKHETVTFNKVLSLKKEAVQYALHPVIVAPSKWMAEQAKKSIIFNGYEIKVIPYGLNSNVFQPRDKMFTREILNLPKDKTIILFIADSTENKRKGYEFLLKAFKEIDSDELILLSIGKKNYEQKIVANLIELGEVHDELFLSVIYSAADVFVIPSLMDNLPNTVLESIMCGTPVIGFPVGGIPEMVEDGINGYLTEEVSVSSLVKAINRFLMDSGVFNNVTIRNNAVVKYDLSLQSKAYENLFYQLI